MMSSLVLLLLCTENNRDGSYVDQQGASHNVHGNDNNYYYGLREKKPCSTVKNN